MERDLDAAADALITVATALESHDRFTLGHSERVAARAVAVAQVLGLDEQAVRTVRLGALLRDIGNAKLPPALVQKHGELSGGERELVEKHPIHGEDILKGLAPLHAVLPIVRWHHERLDGQGYPDGLRADQLPLEVRIVTVADRFEALLVDRTDRAAVSEPEAVRILQGAVGKGELDPAVVAALAAQVRSTEGAR
jgi:putative two-component system response regulator